MTSDAGVADEDAGIDRAQCKRSCPLIPGKDQSMMRTFPLAAAIAALCFCFALPARSSDDASDPSMKFFYPDGSIQWDGDREFDREFNRIEKERNGGAHGQESGGKSPVTGSSSGDGAAPDSGRPSH